MVVNRNIKDVRKWNLPRPALFSSLLKRFLILAGEFDHQAVEYIDRVSRLKKP